MNPQQIPPTPQALNECLALSEEILRNIELSEISLSSIMLKASRLARLLNDFDHHRAFTLEAGGYPSSPTGIDPEVFATAKLAGRLFREKIKETGEFSEFAYTDSVSTIEQLIRSSETALEVAGDPNVSLSSANPQQYVFRPPGNAQERAQLRKTAKTASDRLAARRAFVHVYTAERHYELKFSGIAEDIFSRLRERVDSSVGYVVPAAVQKFTAVYANLGSENPEDWSNAVHSCRRILQDLADALYPAREDRIVNLNGKEKRVKLGSDNYINRLVAYLEENSSSERFQEIVGSHLRFMGERLDSVFQLAQKGSHATITDRSEADRCVIYTYMLAGDILALGAAPV